MPRKGELLASAPAYEIRTTAQAFALGYTSPLCIEPSSRHWTQAKATPPCAARGSGRCPLGLHISLRAAVVFISSSGAKARYSPLRGKGVGEMPKGLHIPLRAALRVWVRVMRSGLIFSGWGGIVGGRCSRFAGANGGANGFVCAGQMAFLLTSEG